MNAERMAEFQRRIVALAAESGLTVGEATGASVMAAAQMLAETDPPLSAADALEAIAAHAAHVVQKIRAAK